MQESRQRQSKVMKQLKYVKKSKRVKAKSVHPSLEAASWISPIINNANFCKIKAKSKNKRAVSVRERYCHDEKRMLFW